MSNRRHRPRFRLQRHQPPHRLSRQRLHRHVPLQPEVAGHVDFTRAAGPQAPRQPVLAGQQPRRLDVHAVRPAAAPGPLAGRGQASALGAGARRRPGRRVGARRPPRAQPRQREPGRRRQRFEERDVDRPHDAVVEAPADDQHADDLRAGTEHRRHDVGPRLDDPHRIVPRQQLEHRRRVVRMHPHRPAAPRQHVHDGGAPRQRSHPAVQRGVVARARVGRDQQGGPRPAPAVDGASHPAADRPHLRRLGEGRRGGGERLPLVGGLRIDPDVEPPQQPPAQDDHQQQDAGRREQDCASGSVTAAPTVLSGRLATSQPRPTAGAAAAAPSSPRRTSNRR